MAIYSFKCRACGSQAQVSAPIGNYTTPDCHGPMLRDYMVDRPNVNIAELKKRNNHQYSDNLFLPTAKDFESPSDPDGGNGLRAWCDDHTPKEGNKKPRWPKLPDKRVF